MTICRWCGDTHDVTALCQRAQRGLTRRSFLFLFGAGTAGLILAPEGALSDISTATYPPWQRQDINLGQLVAEDWNRLIDRHFARLMAERLTARVKYARA